jgi:predicted DNA-binding protein
MENNQNEVIKTQSEEKFTDQIATRVNPKTKARFKELCEAEGKDMSIVNREMIEAFVED